MGEKLKWSRSRGEKAIQRSKKDSWVEIHYPSTSLDKRLEAAKTESQLVAIAEDASTILNDLDAPGHIREYTEKISRIAEKRLRSMPAA